MNEKKLLAEFDRQVANLLQKGYADMIGISKDEFLEDLQPLKDKVKQLPSIETDLEKGILPFVLVPHYQNLSPEEAMQRVEKEGKNGITILRPHTSQNFNTIESVNIPDTNIYLLVGIDRGKESINLPPSEAIALIRNAKRSPLTIDEGIAIVTHFPEFLMKNNCFSLLGSRTGIDQRVPAIWINSKKEPNLGWCWDGNPHTWLGSASCIDRVGF